MNNDEISDDILLEKLEDVYDKMKEQKELDNEVLEAIDENFFDLLV